MKIIINEKEYQICENQTISGLIDSISDYFFHLEYLTKDEELINCNLRLVEVDATAELLNINELNIYENLKIYTNTDKILKKINKIIEEISNSDQFKCFVVPLSEVIPKELTEMLTNFIAFDNVESGYSEYYKIEKIDYSEKIKNELVNPNKLVVAIIDPRVKDFLGTTAEIFYQALKDLGFDKIIEVDLGLKIKAIEEVDNLTKRIAETIDGHVDRLPVVVTDDVEILSKVARLYPDYKKLFSNVKLSFQIEANIYRNYYNKEQNNFVVYLTMHDITNANSRYILNEDIDSVISLSQIIALFTDNNIYLDEIDFEKDYVSYSKLSPLMIQSFYELVYKRKVNEINYNLNNGIYQFEIVNNKHSYKGAVLSDVSLLRDIGSDRVLILLTNDQPYEQKEESLYKNQEINNIYKKYLETPGNKNLINKVLMLTR